MPADTEHELNTTEAPITGEAIETSSPEVTEGPSSSDGSAEQPQDLAAAIRDKFLEEFGDEGSKEPETTTAEQPEDTPGTDSQTDAQSGDEDDKFRLSEAEFKGLPPRVRNRIGHLSTKAAKLERQVTELTTARQGDSQVVERMNQLETFVRDNRIQPQALSQLLGMAARLSRGDYQGFLDAVKPFVSAAEQASGLTYAPDLKDRVDSGEISEDVARQMTRDRIARTRAETQARALEGQVQRTHQGQAAARTSREIIQAVAQRETELKADPDYARLSPALQEQMKFVLSRGVMPRTPAEASALVSDAWETVKRLSPRPPQPKPTLARPGATTPSRGAPTPKSTKEAIIASLASD